ncbi:uncharacterized protein V2V93DRAFT_365650 [Kockiozyma suomiensis]|uniref:uncharacterized protein n=1 Tax=Kockiozyma suomiensis TaxID=1337062 RepID=UPI003342F195
MVSSLRLVQRQLVSSQQLLPRLLFRSQSTASSLDNTSSDSIPEPSERIADSLKILWESPGVAANKTIRQTITQRRYPTLLKAPRQLMRNSHRPSFFPERHLGITNKRETWREVVDRLREYNELDLSMAVFRIAKGIANSKVIPSLGVYSEILLAMARRSGPGGVLISRVFGLVEELLEQDRVITAHMFEQLFKAIAKCPHPVYRHRLLSLVKDFGYQMQPFDIERLVQSYLCSSELELALEAFDEFEKRGLVPVTSVFTRLMATLMDYDEYSLAFSYMKRHVERSQVTVPKRLWGRLLSCCARDFLYKEVAWIWDNLVESGALDPDDGTCINTVLMCRRHIDYILSCKAMRILHSRRMGVDLNLTEILVETYHSAKEAMDECLEKSKE